MPGNHLGKPRKQTTRLTTAISTYYFKIVFNLIVYWKGDYVILPMKSMGVAQNYSGGGVQSNLGVVITTFCTLLLVNYLELLGEPKFNLNTTTHLITWNYWESTNVITLIVHQKRDYVVLPTHVHFILVWSHEIDLSGWGPQTCPLKQLWVHMV